MKRRLACLLFGVGMVFPVSVQGGDALTDALASIPGDAIGFVCIPSIKALDDDYQRAIVDLGLQPFIQPPLNSLVGLLKQNLPKLQGMDESGSFAVVFMPAATPFELMMKQAVLIPTKDPKAMIETMGGQPAGEGLWAVDMMGQPAQIAVGRNHLIMAQMPDVAKAIKDSQASIGGKLKPSDRKALEGLDLFVWVDGERLSALVKPMVDMAMAPMLAMQQSAGGFEAKSAQLNKKNIDRLMEGAASLAVGVSLDAGGVGLRFAMTAKAGSDFAKQVKMKNTSGSLMQGLPAASYMMAFGQTVDPAQTKASLDGLDDMFALGKDVEQIDPEKLKKLQGLIEEAAPLLTGLRGVIDILPPGPDGLFGLSALIETTDGGKLLDLHAKAVELIREMLDDAAKKLEDPALAQVKEALSCKTEAEQIGGVKVQHVRLDLTKMEDVDEEDRGNILKVIGQEGVLFRLAPMNPKTVVLAFGGGKDRMAALMKQAASEGAPLDADAGIKKVSTYLPKERSQVFFVDVDRILAGINKVMAAIEEEALPVQMPSIDAPLAMVGSGGDGWAQFDIFAPTELLVAGKNAVMSAMGTTAPPPPGTPPAAPEKP